MDFVTESRAGRDDYALVEVRFDRVLTDSTTRPVHGLRLEEAVRASSPSNFPLTSH